MYPFRSSPERCRGKKPAERPPSLEGTLIVPSNIGGSNWGGVAFEPERGLLLVNTNHVAAEAAVIPREDYAAERAAHRDSEVSPQAGTPYGIRRKLPIESPIEIPCHPPPWGTLAAVDLASGEVRWEVPLGTLRDRDGVPSPLAALAGRVGMPNFGGPIVTAGGVVFIAASTDNYLRAFDIETGDELWEGRLPAGGQATPMTYRLSEDGKQYVVIAAGGHGKAETTLGDYVVAFALP